MNTGALEDFKKHELYDKFMKAVNQGIDDYRALFPNDKVELIEEGDSMYITMNGVKTNEIEFDFLLKGKEGKA